MACNSLSALPRACGGVVAGLEKVYIIAFKDLSGTTSVYSATTGGTVVSVNLVGGKKYQEIGLLKSTSGLNQKLTKDNTKGVSYFTHTFTVTLGDLSAANYQFVTDAKDQPVSVIVKSRTGNYYVAGLNGQFEVTAVDGGTGTAESDLIGYTVTFEGVSTTAFPLLDSSIVASLIA